MTPEEAAEILLREDPAHLFVLLRHQLEKVVSALTDLQATNAKAVTDIAAAVSAITALKAQVAALTQQVQDLTAQVNDGQALADMNTALSGADQSLTAALT